VRWEAGGLNARVKHGQPLAACKPDFPEGLRQRGEIFRGEFRPPISHVQQRPINAAPAARACELSERGAAGGQVQLAMRSEANKLACSNDLKVWRHMIRFSKMIISDAATESFCARPMPEGIQFGFHDWMIRARKPCSKDQREFEPDI